MAVVVPNVPGVPAVAFAPVFGVAAVLLTQDDPSVILSLFSPQWGVFSDGSPVIVSDIVTDLGFQDTWTISDYPVEQGGFETYDKVSLPYEARVRFVAGGNSAARENLLSSIVAIAGDLNFYDVVTPEQTYNNANILRYEYRRVANDGVSLLIVDVTLQEVRVTTTGNADNTAQPSGADQQNNGTTQATTATQTQVALGQGGIGMN